jgi:hypothetical protein
VGALEDFLSDLRDIKLSGEGVSELSYYPALRQLLEEVGGGLKPKVRCFMNLKNHGAGLPDGGLFTADQVRGTRAAKAAGADGRPVLSDSDLGTLGGQKPARGAIEVKPPAGDVRVIAASPQVHGYLEAYRQVLVTTLREFLLLGIDEHGKPVTLERYSLASTEAQFWALAAHPRRTEQEQGTRFVEFLKRLLLSGATLAAPQDLAWFLASYAREARFLVESAELPALDAVRQSLEDTLGVKFEGPKGESTFSVRLWSRPCSTACLPPGFCGVTSTSPATARHPRGGGMATPRGAPTAPASTGRPPPGPSACRWSKPSSPR